MPARLFLVLLLSLATALSAWGQAINGPEIVVYQSGTNLADGGTCDFISARVGLTTSQSILVQNIGQLPLTGLALTVDGAHPQDFVISRPLNLGEMARGVSDYFSVRFAPSAVGVRTATLHIASNDPDENPFDIHLTGLGSVPEIRVEKSGGVEIPAGSTYDFGTGGPSLKPQRRVYIRNIGEGLLNFKGVSLTGDHPDDFRVTFSIYNPSTEWISPSFPMELNVVFQPTAPGLRTATLRIVSDDEDEAIYEFTITGTGDMAGLQVTLPGDTQVLHNSNCHFGASGVNAPPGKALTFTIANPGTKTLSISTPTLYFGGGEPVFSIISPPAGSVEPGASTNMTVQFAPLTLGLHVASLSFNHNSTNLSMGSFNITLRGTGAYTGITFESAVFEARPGDTQGLVKLKRTEADIPATVELQTLKGVNQTAPPFSPALPGTDFIPLGGPSSVITFAAGEAEKTVVVTLSPLPSRASINRHLKLKLVNAGPGVQLGASAEATLRILGDDQTKPRLTITAPAAGKVTGPAVMRAKFTVGDARGIRRVECALNGGLPVVYPFADGATSHASMPCEHDIEPVSGPNVLVITAYDLMGNSTTVTRSFTFTRQRLLTLQVLDAYHNGQDVIFSKGATTFSATPVAAVTVLPGGHASERRELLILPGTRLKVGATPKAGHVFDQWILDTIAPSESMQASLTGSDLTLLMPDEDLVLIAGFIPSPYDPSLFESRSVHWLLTANGEPTTRSATAAGTACLNGTLTSGGGFTGKLQIAGQTLPVTATFFPRSNALFTVAGKKQDWLPCPGGKLQFVPVGNGADIHLPDALFTSTVGSAPGAAGPGRRGFYSQMRTLNTDHLTKGYYTVTFPSTSTVGTPVPVGAGYASINLSPLGVLTLAGVLADGTPFTHSTDMISEVEALIFSQLPTPGATTKLGLLAGLMKFDKAPASTDVTANLNWYRPATTNPKVLLYPAGWPGGIPLAAQGALYSPAITVQSALGITTQSRLQFTGGGLTAFVEKTNFNIVKNAVVKVAPADASYTLSITPATGFFSGTFTPNWTNPAATKPTFKGVILQKWRGTAAGFFLNNAKTPPANGDGSGTVILGAPPQE